MDFSTAEQKVDIRTIFDAALAGLQDADRELGQLQEALPLLLRGIGLHHGGLLPILKEVTELLFSERLLSVLLCTETFAMVSPTPLRTP
jgi:ATP-dependent RNA helicase DOB1